MPAEVILADPLLGHRLRPHGRGVAITSDFVVSYDVNSDGFRDREYQLKRTAGRTRVAALGDSFTFGEGVALGSRFTDVLNKELPQQETINMGVPGWGIDQAISGYRLLGERFQPDVVCLFINYPDILRPGPDFRTLSIVPQVTESNSETLYLDRATQKSLQLNSRFVDHSVLLSWMTFQWKLFRLRTSLVSNDSTHWQGMVTSQLLQGESTLRTEPKYQHLLQNIRDFAAYLAVSGTQLLVINIEPSNRLDLESGELPPTIEYLNLTPQLIARSEKNKLRFTFDRHFNPETHKAIGMLLAEYFRKRLA